MTERKKTILSILSEYVLIFAEFSFVGWIYEVTLAFIYGHGFVNRGFLFGPFLPIYGFGGIILVLALKTLMKKKINVGGISITPLLVFISIVLITTTLELASGLIIDQLLPARLWDYSDYSFNFLGIIALNPSIRFGIGGMILLYILLPAFRFITDRLSFSKKNVLALAILVYFLIDFTLTLNKPS